MNITDRIALFIEKKGISRNKFDALIGTSSGYIGKQILKSASIGGDIIEKIIQVFPELNPLWLITGKGEILLEEEKEVKNFAIENQNVKRILEIQKLQQEEQQKIYDLIDLFIRDSKARKSEK